MDDPDAVLDRYFTLTGWSDALAGAGAARVAVVQRFHRDALISRGGVDYVFRKRGLAAAVAGRAPDVTHVNGLTFPAATWRLRRALPRQTAIVVQNHSDGGPVGRAPWRQIGGRALRGAVDGFLFAAAGQADVWRQAGYIAPAQAIYEVMPASTTFRPLPRAAAREESGVSGSPALLWVGRLNRNKDPLTVLDGFERALARLPGAALTMVYSADDLQSAVRARVAASPRLSERVRLVGGVRHERLAAYFSAADFFVSGSHHEGSGYALMEACACGAVPVVTSIPTYRLLTGESAGQVGALWTAGDAESFARALVDAALRNLDEERARVIARFEREWSWAAVGRRALDIYEDATARKSG